MKKTAKKNYKKLYLDLLQKYEIYKKLYETTGRQEGHIWELYKSLRKENDSLRLKSHHIKQYNANGFTTLLWDN